MVRIQCDRHGLQEETFVCQHIVETLTDRKPRGFYWVKDSEERRPNAWCSECEARVEQTGREWIGESLTHLKAKLVCGSCYDEAARINGVRSLSSRDDG